MTRIVCISDTHNLHSKVVLPEGDVVVCAGDITNHGDLVDVASFSKWVTSFGHSKVITIAGNHDFCFEDQSRILARNILEEHNITYLEDSGYEFNGLNFYGSPWQPWFGGWAFNLHRGPELQRIWARIPNDVSVLITHGMPYKILDFAKYSQENTGCEDLLNRIFELQNLKLFVGGHIHESRGECDINFENRKVHFINACICNLEYHPVNLPIIFDL